MYVAVELRNGRRTNVGRYNSVNDFRLDYPEVVYYVVGFIIYVIKS